MAHRDDSHRAPSEVPRLLAWGMEVVLLAMVVAAPWMYAAVHPGFEFVLDAGLSLLLILWALRMLWQRQVVLARCPITVLLAILLLLGLWQITPLPNVVLRTVAPATAELYDRLLPNTPESVPETPPADIATPQAERTLSLVPAATRNFCFRLLAVLLVFAVVRNNLATVAVVTRVAVVLVANGFALCLFGVIQRLTSPPNLLYWTYPTLGGVFGPFISRNMFPYYVNMCLGLGLGLVLARAGRNAPEKARPGRPASATGGQRQLFGGVFFWLQDSAALWLVAAVAFMGSTVAFSLSRGGFAAMLAGLLFLVALGRTSQSRGLRIAGVALVAGLGLFFLAWLGMPLVESRLKSLSEPDKADTARWPLWSRVLPLVPEFPAWGTGLGTFQYVELWSRQDKALHAAEPGKAAPVETSLFDHAHNDYVEIAVEAGIPGLLVLLAIVALVFRYGLRAVALFPGGRRAGLATGILCGLTAVAVHSLVDFGMHAPAIALLATVLAAMVSGLGSDPPSGVSSRPAWRMRLGGLAPLFGGAVVVLLGLMVCAHTWRAHRVERLRAAAAKVPVDAAHRRLLQLPFQEAAVRLAPQDAATHLELAQTHLELLQAEVARAERLDRIGVIADYCAMVPSLIPAAGAGFPAVVFPVSSDAHWIGRNELLDQVRLKATRKHLYIALTQAIAARNANPLMPEPQLTLGLYAPALAKGDSQRSYYDRVKFLAPRLPDVWYYSGSAELAGEQYDQAWKDWRTCLTLTDRFLDLILFRASAVLPPKELLAKVLPDRPELLVKAAVRLFPREKQAAERKMFVQAALSVLERQEQPLPFDQLLLKMRLQQDLQQWQAAEQTAMQLLAQESTNHEVRLDLARLYLQAGDLEKAEREAGKLPNNDRARKLLEEIEKAKNGAKDKREN